MSSDEGVNRPLLEPFRRVRVTRAGPGRQEGPVDDFAAAEEPLEIRLHGRSFVVLMRTPGLDRELAAGFLLSEAVIRGSDDLGAVEHCRHPDHAEAHNVVDVFLLGRAAAGLDEVLSGRRHVTTSSSCGVCGRRTIESLRQEAEPLGGAARMHGEIFASLPSRLRARQTLFDETGWLHGVGLFTLDGELVTSAEDVGRHNAVDKVIGSQLLAERLPLDQHALAVSGRASFEIVQKAWMARIPIICAVSAPTSLAVELAHEAGITLGGFVRDGGYNLYSHVHRIAAV
jgi:FdhD protein